MSIYHINGIEWDLVGFKRVSMGFTNQQGDSEPSTPWDANWGSSHRLWLVNVAMVENVITNPYTGEAMIKGSFLEKLRVTESEHSLA